MMILYMKYVMIYGIYDIYGYISRQLYSLLQAAKVERRILLG